MTGKTNKSRGSSSCKPVLSNITNTLSAAEEKEHQRKKKLILEDFKKNVSIRVDRIKAEQEQLEKSLLQTYAIYQQLLEPWSSIPMSQLLLQSEGQPLAAASTKVATDAAAMPPPPAAAADEVLPSTEGMQPPRMSNISSLVAQTGLITKPKGKKKAAALTATRQSSRARVNTTKMAALSTVRAPRNRKGPNTAGFVTPAGQRVFPTSGDLLLVTPKFDPRVPLPQGTLQRHLLPNEVAMSLAGSPVTLSPTKPKITQIVSKFLDTLEKEAGLDAREMKQYHSVMQRFINNKAGHQ